MAIPLSSDMLISYNMRVSARSIYLWFIPSRRRLKAFNSGNGRTSSPELRAELREPGELHRVVAATVPWAALGWLGASSEIAGHESVPRAGPPPLHRPPGAPAVGQRVQWLVRWLLGGCCNGAMSVEVPVMRPLRPTVETGNAV